MRDVAAACVNARFNLINRSSAVSIAALYTLGPRLDEITTLGFGDDDDFSYLEWKNAWDKCRNVRELDLIQCDDETLGVIFASPKKKLKVLSIHFTRYYETNVEEVMNFISKATQCVEKFIYHGPRFYHDTADKFFEKNRASLKHFEFHGNFYDAQRKMVELLPALLKLPALQELILDVNMPEEIQRTLERSGVYWRRHSSC